MNVSKGIIKIFRNLILASIIVFGSLAIVGTVTPAQAACSFGNLTDPACQNSLIFSSTNICSGANGCITFFINLVFLFAVLATFVVLVWGGLDYIGSGGDSGKVASARGKIQNAIIGLIIVILAWALTNLALTTFSSGTRLEDILPSGQTQPTGGSGVRPQEPR